MRYIILLLFIPLISCTPKYEQKGFKSINDYRVHLTDSITDSVKSDIISEIDIEFEEATSNILPIANQFKLRASLPWFLSDAFWFYFYDNNKLNVIERATFSDDSMEIIYNDEDSEPLISCDYSFKDGYLKISKCDKTLNGEYIWGEANQLYDILDRTYKLKIEFRRSLLGNKPIKGATLFLINQDEIGTLNINKTNYDIKFIAQAYKGTSDKLLNAAIDFNKYIELDKQKEIEKRMDKEKFLIDFLVQEVMRK
tara:strand:- start:1803 stop:2564 length:762 start_codon:yes stop_codon:yes gene_type:complete